jgi:hypothetical protein
MSRGSIYPVRGSRNPETEIVAGILTIGAADAVTKVAGRGWSATCASGVVTITLSDTYNACLFATAAIYGEIAAAAAANNTGRWVITSVSGTTIVFTRLASIAADATTTTTAAASPTEGDGFAFFALMQRSNLSTT